MKLMRENLTVANMPPFQAQTEHFGRVCRDMEESTCSDEDGLAVVKMSEAVVQALVAGDGLPVNVEHSHHGIIHSYSYTTICANYGRSITVRSHLTRWNTLNS